MAMTQDSKLLEEFAAIQHAIWVHWMTYFFSVCKRNNDGTYTVSVEHVERWQRQMTTSYTELSEQEKVSDREQARKVLTILHAIK